jgi:2-amino-4-hydroxy-6-hydroxymethyldihydropteridine diphosphokinase
VTAERNQIADAFVSVGANIDPERNVVEALRLLSQRVRITGVSTFYRTKAVGRPEQQDFLNGVCKVATDLSPRALKFDVLRDIERRLGRVRTADKYAARTIDLDVILHGRAVLDEPDLRIPDPDIRTRAFVAVPLLQLAPDLRLPDTGEALATLVDEQQKQCLQSDIPFTNQLRGSVQS